VFIVRMIRKRKHRVRQNQELLILVVIEDFKIFLIFRVPCYILRNSKSVTQVMNFLFRVPYVEFSDMLFDRLLVENGMQLLYYLMQRCTQLFPVVQKLHVRMCWNFPTYISLC
jgi:hypothetical protein